MSTQSEAGARVTTLQRLSALIKSARDLMRKDKGLNGDLDRLPMLTWIMFLKFLDDSERVREVSAELEGLPFTPAIAAPYRWRDWAAIDDGITGDALLAFVSNERTVLPDGTEGPGLFPYLRRLQGDSDADRRDVVATVFRGTTNRMINGYLLRDVINKVDEIHFDSSVEIHTLGALYESMLREVRDAAGDSGEFYTPRPLIQFIVGVLEPRIGESILDPACGTGGFLVEAYKHMLDAARTVEDKTKIGSAIRGGEPKPLPYLLAQMNLLLHGVERPSIDSTNSLAVRLADIGERERVDVVLTNPPFGGEEERGVLANFPADLQTTETALLFLQLIMRRLRRARPGRAGVIVPNTTLFYGGVAAKVRRQLLQTTRLSAVVRLPKGVFEPYTDIETNVLFFEAGAASDRILYYRLEPPEGRPQYTKTQPLRVEDLAECSQLLTAGSAESPNAWWADAKAILATPECDLDLHNPKTVLEDGEPPREILTKLEAALDDARTRAASAVRLVERLESLTVSRQDWRSVPLRAVLHRVREPVTIEDGETYKRLRIQVKGRGVLLRDEVDGSAIGTKRQFRVRSGQFVLSKIDARNGAFGIVPDECDGAVITGNFWAYDVDDSVLRPRLLQLLTQSRAFIDFCVRASPGATNRRYLQEPRFLAQEAYVPASLEEQDSLGDLLAQISVAARVAEVSLPKLGAQYPALKSAALDLAFALPAAGD